MIVDYDIAIRVSLSIAALAGLLLTLDIRRSQIRRRTRPSRIHVRVARAPVRALPSVTRCGIRAVA